MINWVKTLWTGLSSREKYGFPKQEAVPEKSLQEEADELWAQIQAGDVGLIPHFRDSVAGFEKSGYINREP